LIRKSKFISFPVRQARSLEFARHAPGIAMRRSGRRPHLNDCPKDPAIAKRRPDVCNEATEI